MDSPAKRTFALETAGGDPADHWSAYRTFPARIPAALTAIGGLSAFLGGLGTWIRATRVTALGSPPEIVDSVSGSADPAGVTLAVLGGLAAAAAVAWFAADLGPKAAPILASLTVVGLSAWKLWDIDRQAAALSEQARANPGFAAYHAGFGWGAWLLLVGAVLLVLGLVVGALREADLRRPA